jgi:hypothetical protein
VVNLHDPILSAPARIAGRQFILLNVAVHVLAYPDFTASAYPSRIASSWKEFIVLLRTLYGKPTQQGSLPTMGSLADGSFTPSHLWSLESGGSALLGTARAGSNYQLVVRFTQKTIKPVALP